MAFEIKPQKEISCIYTHNCGMKGLFTMDLDGGDTWSCPVCDGIRGGGWCVCKLCKNQYQILYDCQVKEDFRFCGACGTIFNLDCVHSTQGCTDSIHYAEIATSYTLGDETLHKIPKLETCLQLEELVNKGAKFNFKCTCSGYTDDCKSTINKTTAMEPSKHN